MKKNILLIYFIFGFGILSFSQDTFQNQSHDNARIATIQNKLQLLSVEVPGLAQKVNISISNANLVTFLQAVSQVHKININPSDQLSTINIINGFNDVTVQDLLVFLVKEHRLDIQFTGNILSIKEYVQPTEVAIEKEPIISYDLTTATISTDLRSDPLPKVFRKITETSGKNLLYTPELSNKKISLFLSNTPLEIALQKLAESNDLALTITRDGFYEFESIPGLEEGSNATTARRRNRRNTNYKVVDTLNRVLNVDLKNASISELIYNVSEDLKLNIFTASPMEDVGNVTVKADAISFDDLLIKIFESNYNSASQNLQPNNQNNRNNNQQRGTQNSPTPTSSSNNFTFKKEGDVYYFGTEHQLTVKKIEMVQMMHRSIAMLGDANPAGGFGLNNFGNNNFITGGTSFFGNQGNNSNFNQNGINSRNQSSINSGNNRNTQTNASSNTQAGSISDIFPASVTEELDIKIDTELNSFVVSGSGVRVEKFKNFVKYIDKPVPLILIEVMILEVSRSATVETGIEFGLGSEPSTTEGVTFPEANIRLGAQTVNRIIGGFDGFGSLNLGNVLPNFYADIKAMETNGNVKILSTPKLSTLNGHKAYLSSGQTSGMMET